MVRLERVTKIFHDTDTVAIKDLDFYMKPGELCFLKGKSGCGKTTLLRLLLGELKADEGNVYVNGKNLAQIDRKQLPYYRRNIGFIFQDYKLIEDMDIFQNVALTKYVSGVANRNVTVQVAHALRMVGLEDYFKRYPGELSGGERQRVAIARALVGNPMLVLADEPTGNLDPAGSRAIMELLVQIHDMLGITMLIATHDNEAIEGIPGKVFDLDSCIQQQV
ncbi:MAG: ABC transporter ATP-binding protein [Lachnospiraceae bacterium]|nr:ABC transporter ATP-binding protein [Lachnospiraceae bacterium]